MARIKPAVFRQWLADAGWNLEPCVDGFSDGWIDLNEEVNLFATFEIKPHVAGFTWYGQAGLSTEWGRRYYNVFVDPEKADKRYGLRLATKTSPLIWRYPGIDFAAPEITPQLIKEVTAYLLGWAHSIDLGRIEEDLERFKVEGWRRHGICTVRERRFLLKAGKVEQLEANRDYLQECQNAGVSADWWRLIDSIRSPDEIDKVLPLARANRDRLDQGLAPLLTIEELSPYAVDPAVLSAPQPRLRRSPEPAHPPEPVDYRAVLRPIRDWLQEVGWEILNEDLESLRILKRLDDRWVGCTVDSSVYSENCRHYVLMRASPAWYGLYRHSLLGVGVGIDTSWLGSRVWDRPQASRGLIQEITEFADQKALKADLGPDISVILAKEEIDERKFDFAFAVVLSRFGRVEKLESWRAISLREQVKSSWRGAGWRLDFTSILDQCLRIAKANRQRQAEGLPPLDDPAEVLTP